MSLPIDSSGQPRAQIESLIGARRYPEALRLIATLEAEHPNDRDLLYARAYCLAATGRSDEARQLAQSLSAIYGDPRGAQLLAKLSAAETPTAGEQRPARTVTQSRRRATAVIAAAVLLLLAAGAGTYLSLSTISEKASPTPTLTVQAPVALETSEGPINLGSHAAPRLVDWNDDGLTDLLVGGGDGYVWIFVNIGSKSAPLFAKGEIVQSGERDVRLGDHYTGACFADMNGDGLRDLVVSHSNHLVGYYPNIGGKRAPAFDGYKSFTGPGGNELKTIPEPTPGKRLESISGRIDVADWDGDGINDLIIGGFDGFLFFYRNTGNGREPAFKEDPKSFQINGEPINSAYNLHPVVFDFNADGISDISYGLNWGNIGFFMNVEGVGSVNLKPHVQFHFEDGRRFETTLREIIQDDAIPNYTDMNNDGTLDVVTGGFNGQLFVMYGVSHRELMRRIDATLTEHGDNLKSALRSNEALRKTYEAQHLGLRQLVQDIQPAAEIRQEIRDWYISRPEIAELRP